MSLISNVVDSIQSPETTHSPIPEAVLHANALLAYVAGNNWHTYGPYRAARPDLDEKGWIVTVTLTCLAKARMYDIEPGGGENQNIGIFMRNADHSHGLPWLYTFESNAEEMVWHANRFGYKQKKHFYVLTAHPGISNEHICGPHTCGCPIQADSTQNVFAGGVDYSLVQDYMLPAIRKPKPPPKPSPRPQPDEYNRAYDSTYNAVWTDMERFTTKRGREGSAAGAKAAIRKFGL